MKKSKSGNRQGQGVVSGASASALAMHLDCTRTYIGKLEADGVLTRVRDGFDLNSARRDYIRFLRRERSTSPRAEADAEFQRAKTSLLNLRIAERQGALMETNEAMEVVEQLCGMLRTGLGSLPTMIAGGDLKLRRRIEECCNDVLEGISRTAERIAADRCPQT